MKFYLIFFLVLCGVVMGRCDWVNSVSSRDGYGLSNIVRYSDTYTQAYPVETIFQNFQGNHGWRKVTGSGSISNDSTVVFVGTNSVRFTSDGAGSTIWFVKTNITPVLNFSNSYLKFSMKVDNPTNVGGVSLYLSNDDGFVNYYRIYFQTMLQNVRDTNWHNYSLSLSDAVTGGSPTSSTISSIELRFNDQNSTPFNMWFGKMSLCSNNVEPLVSFTFDDGIATSWSNAAPVLAKYGYRAQAYLIPELVGRSGYLTLDMLRNLYDVYGWDLSGHADPTLTTCSVEKVDYELRKSKEFLFKNGFARGGNEFAYPQGQFNKLVLDETKRFYGSARSVLCYAETLPPVDPYILKTYAFNSSITTNDVFAMVDKAISNKTWLIFTIHSLRSNPVSSDWDISYFEPLVKYVSDRGIKVRTITEVLNGKY